MKNISRKEFLKMGTALPLALQSLELRSAVKPQVVKSPPKRIILSAVASGFMSLISSLKRGETFLHPIISGILRLWIR